jgi:methionyl-tRNA formyltransferase
MTVGLLVSGNLGNVILNQLIVNQEINLLFVFTDFKSTSIVESCRKNNVPLFLGNPRGGKSSDFLNKQNAPDLLLSVNYLFIVEKDIISKAVKYAINIHGSLLPKYRGRTPHVWAIINNEKTTGITAHIIEEGCDEGDIILQKEVPILDSYTGQDLLNTFNDLYPTVVKEIVENIKTNNIKLIKQNNAHATFFEKRTAEDGKINFDWQKERIYNWVRAQAKPYPGAFCFINNNKIIIHKVNCSGFGFRQEMTNGLVVKVDDTCFYVKTQNGVIQIVDFETNTKIKVGDVLL